MTDNRKRKLRLDLENKYAKDLGVHGGKVCCGLGWEWFIHEGRSSLRVNIKDNYILFIRGGMF